MKKEIEQALANVDIIVANTKLNRMEHAELLKNVQTVKERCILADKLEAENKKDN
jgi:hypothetical protein